MTSATSANWLKVRSVLPILGWIRTYDVGRLLRPDILAGLTVAAFAVPEDMAYASLAGLPPQHGLYASVLALLLYAVLGTSRHLSVGVTSALSIMVAGTLGGLSLAGPEEYLAAAQLTALIAGALAVIAGVFKLGFVVNFISESVLIGFSTGAALFIGSSQLAKLLGIEGVQGNFFERTGNVLANLGETNGWAPGLGVACLALLLSGVDEAVKARMARTGHLTAIGEDNVFVAGHVITASTTAALAAANAWLATARRGG